MIIGAVRLVQTRSEQSNGRKTFGGNGKLSSTNRRTHLGTGLTGFIFRHVRFQLGA